MTRIIKLFKKLLRKSRKKKPPVHADHSIQRDHHSVSKMEISANALTIVRRLNKAGYEAYLVGGCVRDLLLRQRPKDFDVATNATPNQIKQLFRNARVIGRRFKLVHILCHREIIEVATFRGHQSSDTVQETNDRGMIIRDNVYGSQEEDAWRRDFTINSLYYDVDTGAIIDHTKGFDDIQNKILRIIGEPETRYQEDPVRMLRAIRFSAKLSFEIDAATAAPLCALSASICHVPSSRLFDEMTKMYQCGRATTAQRLLVDYGFFAYLFPLTHALLTSDYPVDALLMLALESTDNRLRDNKPVTPAFLFAILLWFPLRAYTEKLIASGEDPLPALDQGMSYVITEQNKRIMIPKRYLQTMREIWILQYRLPKRSGTRAYHHLAHPRFRAAYDFLALRALVGDESVALADWWTHFQEVDENTQQEMIDALTVTTPNKKRSSHKKPRT